MEYKITDPKTRSSAVITDATEKDIFEALLMGKILEFTKETAHGTFAARYPTGKDKLRMDQLRAYRRNGLSASAFDIQAHYNNVVWTDLDVCIFDGPDWYRKAKADNPNWTWEDCPDEELIAELHRWVSSFRNEIQSRIGESRLGKVGQECKLPEPTAPMGTGAFSGLTNRPSIQGT